MFATPHSTIAGASWAVLTLPRRDLQSVPAHRLALPRAVSLVVYGLSMPARLVGKAIAAGWTQPIVGFAIKVTLGFFLLGILGVRWAWGFPYYVVFLLSPLTAPFVVQWAARACAMSPRPRIFVAAYS